MGIKLPPYPWKFEVNTLYHDLYDQYVDENSIWDKEELFSNYPNYFVEQVLKYKILVPQQSQEELEEDQESNILIAGFHNSETIAGKILELVSGQICSYLELQNKLPKILTHQESIKHNISFLCNFKQVQCFTSPASARTFIAIESGHKQIKGTHDPDHDIDLIYFVGDQLESRFQYKIDFEESPFTPFKSKHSIDGI
jgi:hypothetical protein